MSYVTHSRRQKVTESDGISNHKGLILKSFMHLCAGLAIFAEKNIRQSARHVSKTDLLQTPKFIFRGTSGG